MPSEVIYQIDIYYSQPYLLSLYDQKGNNFGYGDTNISGVHKAPDIIGLDDDHYYQDGCDIRHQDPQYKYYTTS